MQAFFLNIDNVAFYVMGFAIYWYSLAYIVGIIAGYFVINKINLRTHQYDQKVIEDLLFFIVIGIVVGGRLGHCLFYDWQHTIAHPLSILATREGGMSFHGGIIGSALAILWVGYRHKVAQFAIGDMVASVAPIGLMLGRIANFINQESIGVPSDGWGVIFPKIDYRPRYPTQLVEALVQGPILMALMWLAIPYLYVRHGMLTSLFLIYYGGTRLLIEAFKEPEGYLFGVNIAQLLCFAMVVMGVALSIIATRSATQSSKYAK
jgi:phosphatidylglycerol:prolipoprotein diacylglycerol transferase